MSSDNYDQTLSSIVDTMVLVEDFDSTGVSPPAATTMIAALEDLKAASRILIEQLVEKQ